MRWKDFVPSKYAVVCSEHFAEKDIDRTTQSKVQLRDNAIPTINSFRSFYERKKRKRRLDSLSNDELKSELEQKSNELSSCKKKIRLLSEKNADLEKRNAELEKIVQNVKLSLSFV